MKFRLREKLCFEFKKHFKNHSIYLVNLPPFPPGTGMGVQYFGDGGPGDGGFEFLVWTEDPGTGIFSLTRGFETLKKLKVIL